MLEDIPERQVRPNALPGASGAAPAGPRRPELPDAQVQEARLVPPDPDRRFLQGNEYKSLHAGADHDHGFGFVDPKQNDKSNGAAEYYAFTKNHIRFIAIDTNAEGGDASGNVDDPQYNWVKKQLKKAKKNDMLAVAFSHHPLRSQTATSPTRTHRPASPEDSQCDLDPRDSTPLHLGLKGDESMKKLFLKFPNFIAYVVGHIHENEITPYEKGNGRAGSGRSPRRPRSTGRSRAA